MQLCPGLLNCVMAAVLLVTELLTEAPIVPALLHCLLQLFSARSAPAWAVMSAYLSWPHRCSAGFSASIRESPQ